MICPQAYNINGVRACYFFKNLGKADEWVYGKEKATEILYNFFVNECRVSGHAIFMNKNISSKEYLKTTGWLEELENESWLRIIRNKKQEIIWVDFSLMRSPQGYELNGIWAVSFLSYLLDKKILIGSRISAIEVLKTFFQNEFSLQKNDFIIPNRLSSKDYLGTSEWLSDFEKNSWVKIIRNWENQVVWVDFNGLIVSENFQVNDVSWTSFINALSDEKTYFYSKDKSIDILKIFFQKQYWLKENDFIYDVKLSPQDFLKTKNWLNEFEGNSWLKILRDKDDVIIWVDFNGLRTPGSFNVNNTGGVSFFRNLWNRNHLVSSSSEAIEILKVFFKEEFGLKNKDFIFDEKISPKDFLKTRDGLMELERESGVRVIMNKEWKVKKIDFRMMKCPQAFKINNTGGVYFFKDLWGKWIKAYGTEYAIEVLKEFFVKEYSLKESDFIETSKLSPREYLKTDEWLGEFLYKTGIQIKRNEEWDIIWVDFTSMKSLRKIRGETFFMKLWNAKKRVYSRPEIIKILIIFFEEEYNIANFIYPEL
jgi:hypothetical protein